MTFGLKLRQLIARKRTTIAELADATGLTRQTLYAIADDAGAKGPTWDTVERIAEALGVSTEEFRSGEEG